MSHTNAEGAERLKTGHPGTRAAQMALPLRPLAGRSSAFVRLQRGPRPAERGASRRAGAQGWDTGHIASAPVVPSGVTWGMLANVASPGANLNSATEEEGEGGARALTSKLPPPPFWLRHSQGWVSLRRLCRGPSRWGDPEDRVREPKGGSCSSYLFLRNKHPDLSVKR